MLTHPVFVARPVDRGRTFPRSGVAPRLQPGVLSRAAVVHGASEGERQVAGRALFGRATHGRALPFERCRVRPVQCLFLGFLVCVVSGHWRVELDLTEAEVRSLGLEQFQGKHADLPVDAVLKQLVGANAGATHKWSELHLDGLVTAASL
jgi:hypothetical protein